MVCAKDKKETCTRMDFFMITYQTGLDDISGIVGLAAGFDDSIDPLWVPTLYKSGIISDQVFCFYFGGPSEDSYLDVG